MSSGTPIKKGRATTASARRLERTEARAYRQQLRAMEARAAKTGPVLVAEPDTETEVVEVSGSVPALMRRGRPVAKPIALTRAQEYAYIRSDMRRLVIIAAGLLVLMFALIPVLG